MTTMEILRAAHAAILSDENLDAWCRSELGRSPTVWLGIDEQNPPREEEYPLVAIVGVDEVRGQSRGEIEYRVHLGAGVVNPELTSSANARIYPGMLQAEALREHAENALYRARLSVPASVESSGEASSVSYHPLYVSYTTITFSALKTSRRGLP